MLTTNTLRFISSTLKKPVASSVFFHLTFCDKNDTFVCTITSSKPFITIAYQFHVSSKLQAYKNKFKRKKMPDQYAKYKHMLENDFEYLYGRSVCELALKSSRRSILELVLLEKWQSSATIDKHIDGCLAIATERNIPIKFMSRKEMDDLMFGRVHQGICLKTGRLNYTYTSDINELLKTDEKVCANRNTVPLWLYLHNIKDPMNVGNILRTAYFLGVDKVLVSDKHSCPLTAVVSKASSGACEVMEIIGVSDHDFTLKAVAKNNWDIVGTVTEDSISNTTKDFYGKIQDIAGATVDKPTIIIIGSEGTGIPDNITSKYCTRLVTIHSYSNDVHIESLNVGSATAVILHHFRNENEKFSKIKNKNNNNTFSNQDVS